MPFKIFSRNSKGTEVMLTILRVIVGIFLVYHGIEVFSPAKMNEYAGWMPKVKSFSPSFIAYTGKTVEFVTGILFVFGLFTRLASIFVIATFAFITFKLGEGRVLMEEQHPFMFCLFGLLFLFAGGGKWSIDGNMAKSKRQKGSW